MYHDPNLRDVPEGFSHDPVMVEITHEDSQPADRVFVRMWMPSENATYGPFELEVTGNTASLVDPPVIHGNGVAHALCIVSDGRRLAAYSVGSELYDNSDVGISISLGVIPGDANADGKIDGADLAIWQQNYDPLGLNAENASWATGDWNADRKVDGGDLALWQQNYDPLGTSGIPQASAEVPEPTTLVLLALGALSLARDRGRGRMK
jgi:hypothetical protein